MLSEPDWWLNQHAAYFPLEVPSIPLLFEPMLSENANEFHIQYKITPQKLPDFLLKQCQNSGIAPWNWKYCPDFNHILNAGSILQGPCCGGMAEYGLAGSVRNWPKLAGAAVLVWFCVEPASSQPVEDKNRGFPIQAPNRTGWACEPVGLASFIGSGPIPITLGKVGVLLPVLLLRSWMHHT